MYCHTHFPQKIKKIITFSSVIATKMRTDMQLNGYHYDCYVPEYSFAIYVKLYSNVNKKLKVKILDMF